MDSPGNLVAQTLPTAAFTTVAIEHIRIQASYFKSVASAFDELARLLSEGPTGIRPDGVGNTLGIGASRITPAAIVRDAARTFGDRPFTLDDLCERVRERFPLVRLPRAVITRRLYDLQTGTDPIVRPASSNGHPSQPNFPMKRKIYQLISTT